MEGALSRRSDPICAVSSSARSEGSLNHLTAADKHALKMAIEAEMMASGLPSCKPTCKRVPEEFLKEEAS